jgi:hypothetical protein
MKEIDLFGPQSPLTPISGEEDLPWHGGLPSLSPPAARNALPTLTEDEMVLESSLPTLPTLTDTSFGGSQDTFGPHTPAPQLPFNNNSVLRTPRKAPQHRHLARSPAMSHVAYWRQSISGIAEADVRINENGEAGCFLSQEEADEASFGSGSSTSGAGNLAVVRNGSNEYTNAALLEIQQKEQMYAELMASQASGRITFEGRCDLGSPIQLEDVDMDQNDSYGSGSDLGSDRTEPASIDGMDDSPMGDDTTQYSPSSRNSPDDADFELAIKGEESEDPTVLLPRDDFVYQRVRAYGPHGKPLISPDTGKAVFVYVAKRLDPIERRRKSAFGPGGTLLSLGGYVAPDRTTNVLPVVGPSRGGHYRLGRQSTSPISDV